MAEIDAVGRSGANKQLARRLREHLDVAGMTQADVARDATVSKATVNNALNPDKGPPNADTFKRILDALKIPETETKELLLLRSRAASPPALLDGYLESVERAAREHPHPLMAGRSTGLAEVYQSQQVRRRHTHNNTDGSRSQRASEADLRLATEIAVDGGMCVVLAGPGGGKSSLLRTSLTIAAKRWKAGDPVAAIPVLIQAADLVGVALPAALAKATEGALWRSAPAHGVSAEKLFSDQPHLGLPWLVLVDGLDEILDIDTRKDVLRSIAAFADAGLHSTYRFLVATRPVADQELDILGDVPHYDLLPFATDDLRQVAELWFRALGLTNPEQQAARFTSALDRANLAGMARTPLMAAMLCQLHAEDPDSRLPRSRGDLYGAFLDLLRKRQHTADATGIHEQTLRTLAHWGPAALDWGQSISDRLPEWIDHLAAEHYAGNTVSAIDFIASQPGAQRPRRMPHDVWNSFLTSCLRRSGLLIERAGTFDFLHQTILEYCAASYVTHNGQAPTLIRHAVLAFGHKHPLRYGVSGVSYLIRRRAHRTRVRSGASYLGFLLDAVPESRRITRILKRVIKVEGTLGLERIGQLAQLGTRLPPCITDMAMTRLESDAGDEDLTSFSRVRSARLLCNFDRVRGTNLLDALAGDTTVGLDLDSIEAFLSESDDPDSYFADEQDERVVAAEYLAELGDARGADRLHRLALDTTLHSVFRLAVARMLKELGDPRTIDLIDDLVWDHTLERPTRVLAALLLQPQDGPRCITRLCSLAHDLNSDYMLAAWHLAKGHLEGRLDEPHIADLLDGLAGDPRLPACDRLEVARWLTELGDERGVLRIEDLPPGTTLRPPGYRLPPLLLKRGPTCQKPESF
ncbi:NACHT domain-containing NTPase [Streptomyces sp. NWU339]|uniref:NACHT domain-containing protein n=1 Tax=Streptomyces sp. NWU339 TaxID=2185284 RepID=UPI0015E809F7|nr:helix-turn-helix domain-containing protein [Streptomyces sp. NWU339]